ncbi:MAG: ATP synthase F1 subunit delta [Cryobacterium sp.]|nr:ATP synthase F1 subunit delta [Oligoflexia bacterium]
MSVSRSYATALLEAAREAGLKDSDLDQIESELSAFVSAVKTSVGLEAALTSPVISAADKASVAKAIATQMEFSKLTVQFLTLIAEKGRGPLLEAVTNAFVIARLESEGATLGHVVSADVMNQKELDSLAADFTRKLGKKVVFRASVDASLLAGLKVTVAGTTYDGSMRSQLNQLRERLVYGKPVGARSV